MATQYTSILKLALPTQGELSGTWGDVVNDNITSMVEEAIAGRSVINSWAANSHTLTTADGLTSESRAAMLEFTDTGTALSGAATVICPTATKIYVCKNGAGQTVTVKTAAGTGVAIPNGETMFVFCDGTNVVQAVTSLTTLKVGTGIQVSTILDEDNMASDSATALATQQSIKAYVDAQITAQDLDFAGDTGTGAVDLDSQTFTVAGTANEIETSASGQTITIGLPTAIVVTTITTTNVQATNIKANDGTAAITIADSTGQVTVTDAVLTTADINGGTADNVTIGGSTAAAGSFTTLGASGTTTLSGALALTGNLDINTNKFNVTAVDGNTLIAGTLGVTGNVDINAGTIDGTVIGGSTAAAITGTTITGTSFVSSGDMTFGDSDKAIFGAGSDLQIYHDGSHSIIADAGSGNLQIRANDFQLLNAANTQNIIRGYDATGAVSLHYGGAEKLATSSSGVYVTGTVTADGLDVDTGDAGNGLNYGFDVKNAASGSATSYAMPAISWSNGGLRWASVHGERNPAGGFGGSFVVNTMNSAGSAVKRLGIDLNGDISFYEDTGTTAKFFWDASAESLGIGNSAPTQTLEVTGGIRATVTPSNTVQASLLLANAATTSAANLQLNTSGGLSVWSYESGGAGWFNSATIDASGNLGIGTVTTGSYRFNSNRADGNVAFFTDGTTADLFIKTTAGVSTISPTTGVLALGTSSTERMRIDSSGNVGIGTSSPDSPLEIQAATNSSSDTTYLKLYNVGENVGHIDFENGNGSLARITGTKEGAGASANDGILTFSTAFDTSLSERMRIDSSGRMGIFNSSPSNYTGAGARTLVVGSNSSASDPHGITIVGGSSSTSNLAFTDNAGDGSANDYRGLFQYQHSDDSLRVFVASTERMRIDSSGNLLVGDTSTVPFDGTSGVLIGGARTSLAFATTGHTHKMLYSVNTGTAGLHFYDSTNNRTDMIWDNSGNLLVGTTSAFGTTGTTINAAGLVYSSADGDRSGQFDRTGVSDGEIVRFTKAGTTVGSIGTSASSIYIGGTSNGAIYFNGTTDVRPWNTSTQSNLDNTMDLGTSAARFKDLYLSGGVYLGGTGAANLLDDYEEGTWTPAFANIGTGTYLYQVGRYTKVGNLVTASVHININVLGTASGSVEITNLPFTAANVSNNYGSASSIHAQNFATAAEGLNVLINPNTAVAIVYSGSGATSGAVSVTHAVMGTGNLLCTLVYFTA
jgi:hypothetical protein